MNRTIPVASSIETPPTLASSGAFQNDMDIQTLNSLIEIDTFYHNHRICQSFT